MLCWDPNHWRLLDLVLFITPCSTLGFMEQYWQEGSRGWAFCKRTKGKELRKGFGISARMGHTPSKHQSSSEGTHHCKQLRFIQEGHHYTYVELSKSAIDSHTAFVQTKWFFWWDPYITPCRS